MVTYRDYVIGRSRDYDITYFKKILKNLLYFKNKNIA